MIRHYLKLIWNRKRSNLLIMVEIFLSFLVVFGVLTIALRYADCDNFLYLGRQFRKRTQHRHRRAVLHRGQDVGNDLVCGHIIEASGSVTVISKSRRRSLGGED